MRSVRSGDPTVLAVGDGEAGAGDGPDPTRIEADAAEASELGHEAGAGLLGQDAERPDGLAVLDLAACELAALGFLVRQADRLQAGELLVSESTKTAAAHLWVGPGV